MEPLPTILTIKEVIYFSRLSRTTIWKAIKRGKLKKCPNTGRAVRIPRDAFCEWLGIREQQIA